ncbi:hypothetical protein SAMN05660199_03150 [Klenkia soli]|uniref:Uncharacterized protein n=1 Tax=Klenkia soli TaxID=1052260 RepID=A0A1H0PY63_9ACTN|nr:hypothetical protein [Klenkia soli]SDP10033.1 hypothetical protein SAMN05660199_03150 [Klenkia soli]
MIRRALACALAVLGSSAALAACAQGSGAPAATPADPDALVLRVTQGGGYTAPGADLGRLPLVSVYRDGRVITEGPVAAIYPGPAWPNVQVARIDADAVTDLVDAALDAGVTATGDLGSPGIADATTTTITLITADGTSTREVYGLREGQGDPALTTEQAAARTALADLVDRLTAPAAEQETEAYQPTAVAALAGSYTAEDGLERDPVSWPGAALPGESAAPGLGCTVSTGDEATAVTAAAQDADALTPWTDGGSTWAVTFRPLLPDETGCADLAG